MACDEEKERWEKMRDSVRRKLKRARDKEAALEEGLTALGGVMESVGFGAEVSLQRGGAAVKVSIKPQQGAFVENALKLSRSVERYVNGGTETELMERGLQVLEALEKRWKKHYQ